MSSIYKPEYPDSLSQDLYSLYLLSRRELYSFFFAQKEEIATNDFRYKASVELKLPQEQAVQIESYGSFECVKQKLAFPQKFICHNFGYFCEYMINKEDLLGCTNSINQNNLEEF